MWFSAFVSDAETILFLWSHGTKSSRNHQTHASPTLLLSERNTTNRVFMFCVTETFQNQSGPQNQQNEPERAKQQQQITVDIKALKWPFHCFDSIRFSTCCPSLSWSRRRETEDSWTMKTSNSSSRPLHRTASRRVRQVRTGDESRLNSAAFITTVCVQAPCWWPSGGEGCSSMRFTPWPGRWCHQERWCRGRTTGKDWWWTNTPQEGWGTKWAWC